MNTTVYSQMKSPTPVGDARVVPPPEEAKETFLQHIWASIAAMVILVVICCVIYPLIVWGIAQAGFPVQANGSLVKKDGTYTTKDDEAVGSALLAQSFAAPQYFQPRPSAANNGAGSGFSPTGGHDASNSGGTNFGPINDKLLNGVTSTQPAPPATSQPDTQTATAASSRGTSTGASATAPAVVEHLDYDGIRLRAIHYAVNNGIVFKLYNVKFDDDGKIVSKTEVPLGKYQDKDGTLKDLDLVDAFPHAGDASAKTVLIADDFATLIPADAVTCSASGLDPHISPENARLQAQRVADARKMKKDDVLTLIEQYTDHPNFGILGDPGVNVLRLNLALDKDHPMPAASTAPAAK